MEAASLVAENGGQQVPQRELRPQGFREVENGRRRLKIIFVSSTADGRGAARWFYLPQKEIAEPHFARRSHQQIDVPAFARVQALVDQEMFQVVRRQFLLLHALHEGRNGIRDFISGRVSESDVECGFVVVLGQQRGVGNGLLKVGWQQLQVADHADLHAFLGQFVLLLHQLRELLSRQ